MRLDEILRAAESVIEEAGTDKLKMNEVAARAGVPIGAVYNFFPNKDSLIAFLLKRHLTMMTAHKNVRRMMQEDGDTVAAYGQIVADSLIAVYAYVRRNKVFREIWSGAQAVREVREIDLADSMSFADHLAERLRRFDRAASSEALHAKALAICHLTGSIMRLATMLDRESADRVVASFIEMALLHIGVPKRVIGDLRIDIG